jgi:hypothetical protein
VLNTGIRCFQALEDLRVNSRFSRLLNLTIVMLEPVRL